ncbi:BT0820 family HAD-type phosphatase [Thalassobellus suaedae]|uniref:Hydrolase n=1 Tax=Thalassobellus suaedae TaxID=3074124 RepID=A0ABY9Y4Y0_9FLAO|nr:hydrolase [Flavobacteriaceae bacterium HL-DH14]WNH13316.1 hydrolase [Flavobacteriaceae bacterium HL-DH10]
MNFNKQLIIAVDFDGTIVEDAYPKIGKPILFAFDTLKKLQEEGHRLILWTYRCEDKLEDAVKFCEDNGVFFYSVNSSFPEEEYTHNVSRKIHADLFIDDRNIGGFLGWGEIYQMLTNTIPPIKEKKKGLFSFFK